MKVGFTGTRFGMTNQECITCYKPKQDIPTPYMHFPLLCSEACFMEMADGAKPYPEGMINSIGFFQDDEMTWSMGWEESNADPRIL